MDRILRFVNFYPVSLIIGLLAFFNQWIGYFYFGIFFVLLINLFLGQEQVVEDPERSATTHFEIKSRYNWVNYAFSAYTVIAAIVFYFLPINKVVVVFGLWTSLAAWLFWLLRNYRRYYILELTRNYIIQQAPQISPAEVTNNLEQLLNQKEKPPYQTTQLNPQIVAYARVYWERNFPELL